MAVKAVEFWQLDIVKKNILHPGFECPSIGQKGFDSPESLIIGCWSRWKDSEHRRPKNVYDGL